MRKPLVAALLLIPACLLLYRPQASSEQAYYEAWAPFWLPEGGMQATLMLNNNRGEQAPFELEIYDPQGALLEAVSTSAEANASLSIPLGGYLQGASYGSIALRYPSELAGELPAQLLLQAPGLSANYLFSERRFHSVPEVLAAFWLPARQSELYALLLNKGGSTVEVELEVRTDKRQEMTDSLTLGPGMTAAFGLRERYALQQGEIAGSIRVSHGGKPGDVVAQGFVFDSKRGFSATLNWGDAGFASLSSTVILKHVKYGDHEEGFMAPHLVLGNAGDSDILVRPLLRLDGRAALQLQARGLGAGDVQLFSLEPELRRLLGAAVIETALELAYDGSPGSLVAAGFSVDRTLEHAYTSKVAGEAELKQSYSYPFRSDEEWDTKIVVVNRSPEPAGYSLFFFFDGRHYTYPTHHFLQPFEQRVIDVRQVREEQLEDDFRRTLPPDGPLSGQIKLLVHEGYLGEIAAQAVMQNLGQGISLSLSCDTCPAQPDVLYLLDSISGIKGQQAKFNSFAGGPKQQIYPLLELSDGSAWFETGGVVDYDPTNAAVTEVDVGFSADYVKFLSAGQSEIEAQLDSCFWRTDFSTCEPQPGEFGACECECLPIVLTVPPDQGTLFHISPPALVTATNPQLTIEEVEGVPKNGTRDIQISIPQGPLSVDVELTLSTTAGSGSARFASNNSATLKVKKTGTVKVKGVTQSSTVDNIRLEAKLGSSVLDTEDFSVVWVTFSNQPRTSGAISSDNERRPAFAQLLGSDQLEVTMDTTGFWVTPVEIVGTVAPSDYAGPIVLVRRVTSRVYNQSNVLLSQRNNEMDTSNPDFRDDDPQSGGSMGKVFDLDSPGVRILEPAAILDKRRQRLNATQWAVLDNEQGPKISANLQWYHRISIKKDFFGLIVLAEDVQNDNQAGQGTTSLSWDLQ